MNTGRRGRVVDEKRELGGGGGSLATTVVIIVHGLWFLVVLGFWRMCLRFLTAALFAVSCGPSALFPLEMEAVAPPAVVVVEDAREEDQKQVPEVQVVAADLQQQEVQQQQQPEKVFAENNVQEQVVHQVEVVGEQDGGLEVQERLEGFVAADASLSQEDEEKLQQREEQQKDGGVIVVSQKRDRDEQEKEVDKKWAGWPGDNVFRLMVPVQKVGGIIGRKGEFVKKMCEDTRSRIKILEGVPGTPERIV